MCFVSPRPITKNKYYKYSQRYNGYIKQNTKLCSNKPKEGREGKQRNKNQRGKNRTQIIK